MSIYALYIDKHKDKHITHDKKKTQTYKTTENKENIRTYNKETHRQNKDKHITHDKRRKHNKQHLVLSVTCLTVLKIPPILRDTTIDYEVLPCPGGDGNRLKQEPSSHIMRKLLDIRHIFTHHIIMECIQNLV